MKPRPPITRTKVGSEVEEKGPSPWSVGASSRSEVAAVLSGEFVMDDAGDGVDSAIKEGKDE